VVEPHPWWPLVCFFFIGIKSENYLKTIIEEIFLCIFLVYIINNPIFSTLTLIPSGHQVSVFFFHAIELLGIINEIFVIV
jgi:hypothetical protein